MKHWIIGLLVIMLAACQSGQQEQSDRNQTDNTSPYKNLSTEKEEGDAPLLEDPLGQLEDSGETFPDEEPPVESLEPSEEEIQDDGGANHINPEENRALQQTVPETTEPLEEIEKSQREDEPEEIITILPFDQFANRWNAVTDTQFTNLYIRQMDSDTNEYGDFYRASLSKQMDLRIYVEQNYVQALEVIYQGKPTSIEERTEMLMGWAQVINILHPDLEIYDVDGFFSELGVGPNSDISQVKEGIYPYYHIEYQISNNGNHYRFRGNYRE